MTKNNIMSDPIQFPGSPRRPEAFLDQQGKNPFAGDGTRSAARTTDNIFASPAAGGPTSAPEFERTLPHRASLVLRLATLSIVGIVTIVVTSRLESIVSVLAPLVLAISVPAWMMGAADLRAMRGGAMDADGRPRTRLAVVMAMLATISAVVLIAVSLARLLVT